MWSLLCPLCLVKSTSVFLHLKYASIKRLVCNLIFITEKVFYLLLCNIPNTRDVVSSGYPNRLKCWNHSVQGNERIRYSFRSNGLTQGLIHRKFTMIFFFFCCVPLASHGLSTNELEDILSCDEALHDVFQYWTPPISRLSPVVGQNKGGSCLIPGKQGSRWCPGRLLVSPPVCSSRLC